MPDHSGDWGEGMLGIGTPIKSIFDFFPKPKL